MAPRTLGILILGIGVPVFAALVRWRPTPGSGGSWLRSYLLFPLGVLLLTTTLFALARTVGLAVPVDVATIGFVVFGLASAAGAAFRVPIYWEVANTWTLYSGLPERWRQVWCVAAGLLFVALGAWIGITVPR